jgi:hypothetical protein
MTKAGLPANFSDGVLCAGGRRGTAPVVDAAKQLFLVMTPRGTVWLLVNLLSPSLPATYHSTLGYYLGGGDRISARDVLYSATNQLAVQYCSTRPAGVRWTLEVLGVVPGCTCCLMMLKSRLSTAVIGLAALRTTRFILLV